MCTTSLDRAKHIAEELADSFLYADECNKGIVVGGMLSNTVHLGRHDIQLIKDCLGSVGGEISEVVSSFPSMFKPLHGPQGMLYRKEEVVMLDDGNCHEFPAKVVRFLCTAIDGKYQKFLQAEKYAMLLGDDDEQMIDPPSGYKVVKTASPVQIITMVTAISRKVMLYPFNRPNSPGAMIVIDYNRKSVPEELFDIIVPFYPELQDMILIRGDDPHPWLAKVVSIQDRAQTVRVLYYEKDPTRPGQDLFLPNNTWLAYDYVPWNSIIGLALGEWQGNAWQLF